MRESEVVRAHRTALLETAFLLAGDERAAEDRVDRALARLRPGDDHRAAVRSLLRTRPPRGGIAEGQDPWWVSAAELAAARGTAATLAGLDPADRVALVLADHEGLPADADRLARARGRFTDPAGALAGVLAVRRPPVRDEAAAAEVVRSHRRARRLRPVVAVAVLAVLGALAVLVPGSPAPMPDPAGALADATRGSLAGDQAFLSTVRAAAWSDGAGPDVEDRRVVFAGDVLDRRWVLVVGPDPVGNGRGGLVGQWSTGPVGALPDQLTPANRPVRLRTDRPAALLLDTSLLVVAAPGEGVRVSTGLFVGPAGGVQRVYDALPVERGVGAVRLAAPDPGGVAVRVQVVRAGEFSNLTLADVPVTVADTAGPAVARPVLTPLRGMGEDGGARADAVAGALAAATVPTGLDPGSLTSVLLWAGSLPHPLAGSVDVAVLAVPQPSGAVVVSTAWADRLADGTVQQIGCGSQAFPAGTDPATLVVAARCVVADRTTGAARTTVLVTAPDGTAGLVTSAGPVRPEDGAALVPDDARAVGVLQLADGTRQPVTAAGPGDLFDE